MVEPTRIFAEDDWRETALKIWNNFEVNQSCKVTGFENDGLTLVPKGEMVINELTRIDLYTNTTTDGRGRRRMVRPKGKSIGGYIAHKIFRWEKKIIDSEMVFTIWRYQ